MDSRRHAHRTAERDRAALVPARAPGDRRSRWPLVALAALVVPAFRDQVALSTEPPARSPTSSSTSPAPPRADGQAVCTAKGAKARVRFVVGSHLERAAGGRLPGRRSPRPRKGAQTVREAGSVRVTPGTRAGGHAGRSPGPARRYTVSVRLPALDQQLRAHCPGRRVDERSLKVALVTPRFPPDIGGMEEYVGWVAEVLQRSGRYDVTVITTGTLATDPPRDLPRHPGDPARHLADPVEHPGEPAVVVAGTPPADPARHRRRQRARTRARTRRRRRLHLAGAGRDDLPLRLAGQGRPPGRRPAARLRAPRAAAGLRPLRRAGRGLAGVAGPRHRSRPPGAARRRLRRCSRRPPRRASREPRVLYVGRVERTSRWKGLQRPRRLAARGCASSCPTSGSTSSATVTTSPPLQAQAERARRRRPRSTGTASVDHDELPALLPAARA